MMTNTNRGSEWRKWDLHLHVFGTHLNNQFGSEREKYLQKINDSDIDVFGLTDYFTVDNQIDFIKDFKEKYPDSNKTFFVNVEYRLNDKVNDSTHVNSHILFSDLISEDKRKLQVQVSQLSSSQVNSYN